MLNIGNSLEQGFNVFFAFLPKLIAFLVILLIGYIVARVIKGILTKVLQRVGLDRALHKGQAGQYVEKVVSSPSALIGRIAFWLIFLGALSIAISALGIPALTAFLAAIYAYVPNVIAALLIFLVAGAIAGAIGGLVAKTMGDTATGKVVGTILPVLVMGVAIFMILNQLQIAPEIVQILFTALVGGVALGMALAFGLGGRGVAERLLEDAYGKGQEQREQVRQDLQTGKERGEQQAERAKARAQADSDTGTEASRPRTTDTVDEDQRPGGRARPGGGRGRTGSGPVGSFGDVDQDADTPGQQLDREREGRVDSERPTDAGRERG